MASIAIRDLDDALDIRLRVQAAAHGRSVEEETRDILASALGDEAGRKGGLVALIRTRFAALGGVELPVVTREPMRAPPSFEG